MEGIQLSVKQAGVNNNISVIKVGGYIDTTTSAELEHSLESLLNSNCYNIIIDLGNVDYISSAGWGIFISEIKGIREKGGDLKLVSMIPDVYEVFELLEFHYILKAFDTLEEAITDFDKARKKSEIRQPALVGEDVSTVQKPIATKEKETDSQREDYLDQMMKVETKDKSVEDKIKQLVIENPESGSIKIMKELNSHQYGYIKLSWLQVTKYLKQLKLNSKKKRIEFFRKQTAK
ncbi:MAG: STAS domain-containing protein [bacterium]|nr:MAG: STAS domain-containing protein [bacterium]